MTSLVTRTEWDATGESFWCVLNKLAHLNHLRPATLLSIFVTTDRETLKAHDCLTRKTLLSLDRKDNFNRRTILANTNLTEETYGLAFSGRYENPDYIQISASELRYCPACLDVGFHTELFQVRGVSLCPWHNVKLTDGCPTCGTRVERLIPLSRKLDPFRCRNGHSLWPAIDVISWREGPSAAQRRGLMDVCEYIQAAQRALDPDSGEPLAIVSRDSLRNEGWDPLYHVVRAPPAIVERLTKADGRYFAGHVSPVALERTPTRARWLAKLLDEDQRQSWGCPSALLDRASGRYFYDHVLDVLMDEYEEFFGTLDTVLHRHHRDCHIGLHRDRFWDGWCVRDEDICVWRAAQVITRAQRAFGFRDYGTRGRTKRGLSYNETFASLFGIWVESVWQFLELPNQSFERVYNSEFCIWLTRLLFRQKLEATYTRAIVLLTNNIRQQERISERISESIDVRPSAVIDYSEQFPYVILSMRPRRFSSAMRACHEGHHNSEKIRRYVKNVDDPYERQASSFK